MLRPTPQVRICRITEIAHKKVRGLFTLDLCPEYFLFVLHPVNELLMVKLF